MDSCELGKLPPPSPSLPKPASGVWAFEALQGSRLVLGGLPSLRPSSGLWLGVGKGLLGAGNLTTALACPPQALARGLGFGALVLGRKLALGGLPSFWPSSDLWLGVVKGPHGLLGAGKAATAFACLPPIRAFWALKPLPQVAGLPQAVCPA